MNKYVSYYYTSSSTLLFLHKNLNADIAINSCYKWWVHRWQVSGIQMNMTCK